jgi:hypothetical protein
MKKQIEERFERIVKHKKDPNRLFCYWLFSVFNVFITYAILMLYYLPNYLLLFVVGYWSFIFFCWYKSEEEVYWRKIK